ncbi:tryptophan 7-halogenase [Amycolatopsis sp. NPDC049868]|uniref:tryptophan 7-halogenase n=1 Tax=Amycolatopsis sp. NPDC049868 TaxID=3363934 RepID=UPI0037A01494
MHDYDVIVVGGGPGGATVAGLTAAEGHRVLLLDKDRFPRYQIGESLLPATIHGICAMLGVRDEIERAGFVRKRGGTFRWGTKPEPWTFSFAASDRMAGPTSYAYQVERARFDALLLDGARRLGAEVRQEHRALGTIRSGERIGGVRYLDDKGRERRATARFVVDASGHGSRLHHDVGGTREYSPHFRNLALFGYFEGGHRMPAPNAGNILCVSFTDGWFWYIPLSDTLTSVGAVVKHESANKVQGDPAAAYASLIEECPLVSEFLHDARRATEPPYDRIRVRKDYSYDRTALWAPGMVLVGDAACFIDPVFSSGVHLATYSALLAARSINSVLAGFTDEKRCFAEFEARYRREFALFRDFLITFYELDADEEDYFAHARRLTDHHGSAGEAFVDLVGGVSSQDFSRTLFGDVLSEGVQLQLRGLLGEAAGDEPPMFPGGLVPTADGRRWRVPDA